MTAKVSAELLKIRTTRGWWAYVVVIVLFSGLAAAGETGSSDDFQRDSPSFLVDLVSATGVASLLAVILGITVVTTEFRHGTVTPTLLATPLRERALAAKTLAVALVAALFDLLALAVILAVALPWLMLVDAEIHLGESQLLERAAQSVLAAVLFGLMGVAIGALVHSQVAALVGTLVWAFVGEGLLWALFSWLDVEGIIGYLPFQALDAADGTGGENTLSYAAALAVSVAWIAAIGAAGLVRTLRRDIT